MIEISSPLVSFILALVFAFLTLDCSNSDGAYSKPCAIYCALMTLFFLGFTIFKMV